MNSLINARLLKSKLIITDIPANHLTIFEEWRESIATERIFKQTETALHSHFIQKILIDVLGYQGFSGASWTLSQEQKIGKGYVDVALGHFSPDLAQITAPFELKGAKTKDLDAIMSGRHKSPVQQAWEYAMDAPGAQWVLVSNYLEIRLYAVGHGRELYEHWDLSQLTEPAEYARLQWLLHADNLLSGNSLNLLQQSNQLDKEITNKLYSDYKTLREKLLNSLSTDNPDIAKLDLIRYAQKILDRVLFIAFAEDRGLLPDRSIAQAYQHSDPYHPRPVWENFNGLFEAINSGNSQLKIPAYNGGLFASDPELAALVVSNEICQAFKDLAEYDFDSEISVTILGHIFEQSINDIEDLQAQARGETVASVSKRKKHGVVYTPEHITRFIVEHTLGTHLRHCFDELWHSRATQRNKSGKNKGDWKAGKEIQFWEDYQQRIRTTRVVDPACGSGAFLIAAFDYLAAEYRRINDKLADLTGTYNVFDLDKTILNNNLHGVDLNPESIEITKLSLWLKTAKRDKKLNSLDKTIRVGNSVIDDPAYTDKPFDWTAFAGEGFDVVLGNPPYVRQELISPMKPYLQQKYQVYHGVVDLYAYFFELGLNILKDGGRMGYISSSTFFKTGSGENLRGFMMDNACLENVVDFGDLQIFAGVTTYPAILTMRKQLANPSHQLRMLTLGQQLPEDLDKQFSEQATMMTQANLETEAWRLEADNLLALRRKIVADKPTLKQVYGSPLYGIKTGLNAAFVIDRATRDNLVKTDSKSTELIKPFLEGKDLKAWRVEPRDLWLIFTRRGVDMSQYPAVLTYLEQFRTRLEPKPKDWEKGQIWGGRKTGSYKWYEIQDAVDYHTEFEKQKIIYLDIANKSCFSIDSSNSYLANTAYLIPSSDWFLNGLLNSNVLWFFWKGISTTIRGGFIRLIKQYLVLTPIPNATESQKQHIATLAEICQTTAESRYQKQQAVRRRIPDLCPPEREAKLNNKLKSWWRLDFASFRKEIKKVFKQDIALQDRNDWEIWLNQERAKIDDLSAHLSQLEQDLNTAVYALFELNTDEIKLIENKQ